MNQFRIQFSYDASDTGIIDHLLAGVSRVNGHSVQSNTGNPGPGGRDEVDITSGPGQATGPALCMNCFGLRYETNPHIINLSSHLAQLEEL